MKKVKVLFTAALLTLSSMVFAIVDPPGGKFCKNNPTMNIGTCYYSGGHVDDCLTTINAIKDCYATGSD